MALRRIYTGGNFTIPAPVVSSFDAGQLSVPSTDLSGQTTSQIYQFAGGQAGVGNVCRIQQDIEGAGGGEAHGVIATRFTGTDYGLTLTASTSSISADDTLVVCTNGMVGVGKEPQGALAGSLEVSGSLLLPSVVGTFTADGATPVVVNSPYITANSVAFFSMATPGGTPGIPKVDSKVAGTSISLVSEALDTSVWNYLIVN